MIRHFDKVDVFADKFRLQIHLLSQSFDDVIKRGHEQES